MNNGHHCSWENSNTKPKNKQWSVPMSEQCLSPMHYPIDSLTFLLLLCFWYYPDFKNKFNSLLPTWHNQDQANLSDRYSSAKLPSFFLGVVLPKTILLSITRLVLCSNDTIGCAARSISSVFYCSLPCP